MPAKMAKNVLVRLSCSVALLWVGSLGAATVFTNTYTWVDPASSGEVQIIVDVFDNFGGDFSRYEWRYTVNNISYDPTPGLTTGFSGLHLVTAVPGIRDLNHQYGPPGWILNGDHDGLSPYLPVPAIPPAGVGWDTPDPAALGIIPGFSGEFGFTTPESVGIAPDVTGFAVAHSYSVLGEPVGFFSGTIAIPFVPVPAAVWLLGSGLLCLLGASVRKGAQSGHTMAASTS